MEKREPSYIVGGNANWCSHLRKQYGDSSKKLKMELPCDPAVPLLGMYPKNRKPLIWKHMCAPMFTAALYIVVKIWK